MRMSCPVMSAVAVEVSKMFSLRSLCFDIAIFHSCVVVTVAAAKLRS